MKYALLHTKLNRPSVAPDIVPRDRLIKRLDQGRKRPLTLISAPAGYGKSTLASRWIASGDYPCAWVSLDKNDNDLRQFLSYLLAAIQQVFDKIHLRTETFLDADRLPPTDELARYLLNDLHQVPEPFSLVLDDYQRITETSVNDLVAALLEHPAQTMHLVLLTRKDPSLPIATLRGRGLVTDIRASDLRFTPDEAAAFLSRMLDVAVDDDTATLLEAKTEGWAAGLRLAGLYLRGHKNLKLRLEKLSGSSVHIAEYLVAEVLSRQHPEMESYLLETSILERFCAPLCRKMHQAGSHKRSGTPEISVEQFIQWLVDANLFVVTLDDEGYWFRYHHLFRSFLKGVLRKKRTADQIAELHRTAGNWFAENDQIEEAIGHLMAAGDTSAVIQLVVDRRYELLNASRFVRLGRWLTFLPEKQVAQSPLLISTRAFIAVNLGNYAALKLFTENATGMMAALSPKSETYAVLKGEVLVLQSLVEMLGGDAQTGLAHAKESLDYLPEDALQIRSLGIAIISGCLQMMGNGKQAVASLGTALSNPIWPTNIQARFHFSLCAVQYMEGNLAGAMNASRGCLRCIKDFPFFHTRALANYFLGAGHYLRSELEAAEPALMKVFDDRHAANPSYVVHAGFILACIYLSQDKEAAATQVFDQTRAFCRDNNHAVVLPIIEAIEAEFALRRGELQRAQQICKHADFDVYVLPWLFYVPKLTPIKLLLAENAEQGLRDARRRLSEMDEQMRRVHRKNVHIEILALLALVCHKQRDEAAALNHLQTALELAESGNWIRTFVDLGMPMIDVLKILVQHQPGQAYAQQTLEACQAEHRRKEHSEPDATSKPRIHERPPYHLLTRREIEIIPLLAEGLSNKEIAARLFVAPATAKTHLHNIYKKLNAKNRIEALKMFRQIGIVNDN